MALDRVVTWDGVKPPTRKQIRTVLVDFLGGIGTVRWSRDRYIVTLPGSPTTALRSIFPLLKVPQDNIERWIEVWPSSDSLYVMTRRADDFTNALAESLAKLFSRGSDGTYTPET